MLGSLLTVRGVAQGATTIIVTATDPGGLPAFQNVSVTVGVSLARLTNNSAADHSPAWSANGARVVFESNRDGNNEVYVMNANGSGTANLTNNAASGPCSRLVARWRQSRFRVLSRRQQ